MPFTQMLLFYIPTMVLGAITVAVFIILSVGGLLLVRQFVPHQRLKVHNDVAGSIFGTLGMAYTVLLAFVVVIVWQNFDKSNLNVQREANCLADLYRDSISFPEKFRGEAQALIGEYADAVINEEWNMLARGGESPKAQELLKRMWARYSSYEPKTENEKIFFTESVRNLNEAGELRRLRLMDSRTGIHPMLWAILLIGGVATIGFTFFFGSENLWAQIMMASTLAMVVGLILFIILLLDFPFTGALSISSDAFRSIARF